MDILEFKNQLNKAQELMNIENYKEAISLLNKLKEIEKESDFNYNLTHKLYQLDSNARSLFNQQKILKMINDLSTSHNSIGFRELYQTLQKETEINLSIDILKREVELLILRDLIPYKIDGEKLIF